MTFCIIVAAICGFMFFLCQLFMRASPESQSVQEWVCSLCGDVAGKQLLRSAICGVFMFCMVFSMSAYADDGPEEELEEAPPPVEEVDPTPRASLGDDEDDTDTTLPPPPTEDPADTPEPTETVTPTSKPTSSPAPTDQPSVIETPPTVDLITSDEDLNNEETITGRYEVQVLEELGRIEAYMVFIVVVILAYFCYRFLRIFF